MRNEGWPSVMSGITLGHPSFLSTLNNLNNLNTITSDRTFLSNFAHILTIQLAPTII